MEASRRVEVFLLCAAGSHTNMTAKNNATDTNGKGSPQGAMCYNSMSVLIYVTG